MGEYGVSVFFGLDGTDQKSLEKYRIGSNFKKVQRNWRAFIKAGGNATWQFIVFEHNEHLLEQAEQMSKDEGFKNLHSILFFKITFSFFNSIKFFMFVLIDWLAVQKVVQILV